MAEEQSQRSLEFQISNETRNITLKNPRIEGYQSCPHLTPELPPGSSDSCQIFSDPDSLYPGGFLVYEAESFTLAVLAFVPPESEVSCNVLHLELSPDKAHLGDLRQTLIRMVSMEDPPDAGKTTASRCIFRSKSGGIVQLAAGPCKVTTTVFHEPRSSLSVKLEEL